jgi:hypothetical protein
LKRLAESIDALAEKDEGFLRRAREIGAFRQAAAADLYAICADFVSSVNRLLARTEIELDPSGYGPNSFQEDLVKLMQINSRGRILQVSFSATPELVGDGGDPMSAAVQSVQAAAIQQYAKQLRLPTLGGQFARLAEQAIKGKQSHLSYLETLLEGEVEEL